MTSTTPTTLGMKLDTFLSNMDSLSSTELYGLIVVITVIISFSLLGYGGNQDMEEKELRLPSPKRSSLQKQQKSGKQPKWFVLKILNYLAVGSFLASVGLFSWNAKLYLAKEDSSALIRFLIGWSIFLCYFFGFFGISFVDHDDFVVDVNGATTTVDNSNNDKNSSIISKPRKMLHEPAPSAPLCSDPPMKKSSSSAVPKKEDIRAMNDASIAQLVLTKKMKDHELEKCLDASRAVVVRRMIMAEKLSSLGLGQNCLQNLPSNPSLDYSRVYGANCEVVVGYVPLPVGMVGPLTLNGESVYIPMATTEGCLVASTQRGVKAISSGKQGAICTILKDGITRAPCLRLPSATEAAQLAVWVSDPNNFQILKKAFESTTSFGKLLSAKTTVAGKNAYLRMVCFSGDAMGMNMVSKGSLAVIDLLRTHFPRIKLIALSGNMCTDKKAAATNWLEGRGKSVVVEAVIPKSVVEKTLKTTVKALVHTNIQKNLVGSAMAGALGGFNAHAANIVTAIFLATGQDPAQNVESSQCITLMEETEDGQGDLWISCTMPCLEVGTVGGGTSLPAQRACLECMGVAGGNRETPGANAKKLATMVAGATMAGELSLLAALAANTLVQAHMKHNRKPAVAKK
eukprot:CAMPEP_0194141524 /NCGR_PEP_ID=MMETSP0152-20130528/10919_1 /TAXON_ID=1049557 /ORGANISM="Thalassiothrix antarctica, Strain L6-D1" /LENGTH=627 /DNA_ID=CAMNT_0038840169 /DNA_START=171 /DNA_END=2054 /DNA_ORIENTATION=+